MLAEDRRERELEGVRDAMAGEEDSLAPLGNPFRHPRLQAGMGRNSLGTPVGEGLRRSRSLRERVGVGEEGRLPRLPTALCATLSLPATHARQTSADPLSSRPVSKHHFPEHVALMAAEDDFQTSADPLSSRPVSKHHFPEHVALMAAEDDFQFNIEFNELRHTGRNQTSLAGEEAGNRPRNRFPNVLPFDHSRVRLTTLPCDYVNANFVSRGEYVAAQAPLAWTLEEWWGLVWEQEVEAVVALTRLEEDGREKCARYWPAAASAPLTTASFRVELLGQETEASWSLRRLRLHRKDAAKPKDLTHFHFTAWPDFGVPGQPAALLDFVSAFRRRCPPDPEAPPVLVHCSAGIGRTGTFVALDQLLQTLPHSELIDVFGLVHSLRQERVSMVQTEQQYAYIHHCLLAHLQGQRAAEAAEAGEKEEEEEEEAMTNGSTLDAIHQTLHSLSLQRDSEDHQDPHSPPKDRPPPLIRVDSDMDTTTHEIFAFPSPPQPLHSSN